MADPTFGTQSNRLARIMEGIVASYDEAKPRIHHLDQMPLPSREDAARIMSAIEEVIYPGYYSGGGVTTREFSIAFRSGSDGSSSICATRS